MTPSRVLESGQCCHPSDCVRHALGSHFPSVHFATSTRVHRQSEAPCVNCMRCPSLTLIWFDVDKDVGTGWGDRVLVEITVTMDLHPSRQFWVHAAASQQVQCQNCLWCQPVPFMQRKIGVSGADPRDEVVFSRTHCSFCRISSMDARWCQLKLFVLVMHEAFQCIRGFIVQAMKLWVQSGTEKDGVCSFAGLQNLMFSA